MMMVFAWTSEGQEKRISLAGQDVSPAHGRRERRRKIHRPAYRKKIARYASAIISCTSLGRESVTERARKGRHAGRVAARVQRVGLLNNSAFDHVRWLVSIPTGAFSSSCLARGLAKDILRSEGMTRVLLPRMAMEHNARERETLHCTFLITTRPFLVLQTSPQHITSHAS